MIDAGANLCSKHFDGYQNELLDYALDAGITHIVSLSNTRGQWDANLALAAGEHPVKVLATVGVHPHNANTFSLRNLEQLKEYAKKDGVVAVGECGLDYNRMFSPATQQKRAFRQQLDVARSVDKPVVLHERDADKDVLEILRDAKSRWPDLRGVVHCFTGNKELMRQYLDLGLHIGVTGWIADRRRNADLVESVKELPLDRLVLETNAPWLVPYKYAKKWDSDMNQPDALPYVLSEVAKVRGETPETVREASVANAVRLFRLSPA